MRKIYVVGGNRQYANWMEGTHWSEDIENADLVVFTGGEDINPIHYGRARHPKTFFNDKRDNEEFAAFRVAKFLEKPMVGICRGAQLLCVIAGGRLIQDQDDPLFFHPIITSTNRVLTMTSMHHQAQFPWDLPKDKYVPLAWTVGNSHHHDGPMERVEMIYEAPPCCNREAEIIYYPDIRGLAIQGHPEMMFRRMSYNKPVAESIDYCRLLLNVLLNLKKPKHEATQLPLVLA